jgi:hypothetical protein
MQSSRRFRRDRKISRHSPTQFYVPSCIFNTKLSSYETIVKFLKEAYGLGFQEIAQLLGKKRQSAWRAYQTASNLFKQSFEVTNLSYPIPVSIFRHSKLSLLETIVQFLRDNYKLTNSEISALLMRDERNILTVHKRTVTKELHGITA